MRKRRYLTVRNLPADVAEELERERKRGGRSLNQTVVSALRKGLGLGGQRKSNGLAGLASTWSQEDADQFDRTVDETSEQIDNDEAWR